jgi:hypothetical protein
MLSSGANIIIWDETLSSSSFIEPPATGHHQWSGAKRFSKIIFFLQYFLHYTRYDDDIFDKKTKMAQYSFIKKKKSEMYWQNKNTKAYGSNTEKKTSKKEIH